METAIAFTEIHSLSRHNSHLALARYFNQWDWGEKHSPLSYMLKRCMTKASAFIFYMNYSFKGIASVTQYPIIFNKLNSF